MAEKAVTKTREIVAWAKANEIHLILALRMWDMYVLRAFLYGANLCLPTPSDKQYIDRTQRQCGRLLLGFCRSSRSPAVLAALGWTRPSESIASERISLLQRTMKSQNVVVRKVADATSHVTRSWVSYTLAELEAQGDFRDTQIGVEWHTVKAKIKDAITSDTKLYNRCAIDTVTQHTSPS